MPDDRQHRMLLVNLALPDVGTGVSVHVAKDFKAVFPTILPKGRVAGSVEGDHSGFVGVRVEVV